ncbi:hypothetical protein DPMN_189499 [Dreissena polymorpha]|uniref:Uncharacterized protein n=1 Tax=Dreissena polymorpha TaxID=45954 RepID=A0A9D4DS21_DREPO|nr:hypothetical protein DPMN_189499 [Dreissena polymorpha]
MYYPLTKKDLDLYKLNNSLQEISINWTFAHNYNTTGFIPNSVVEYFTDTAQ